MKPVTLRSLHSGGRLLAFAGAAAALVVAVPTLTWSADLAPNHRSRIPLERTPVTAASLTCPGPELVGLSGAKDVVGTGGVLVAAPPLGGSPTTGASVRIGADALPAASDGTVLRTDLTGDTLVTASATEAAAPGLVAAQSWTLDATDVRGLVSVACERPSSDFWLVAGGNEPGRQERIVLANPGANEVVADVVVHSTDGPVESPTGRGLVVPARGRAEVLLDAIAQGRPATVVHVSATGGSVVGVVNDTWLDGTIPLGSATAAAAAAPATTQVIPMVRIPAATAGDSRLRVGVPGDRSAVVQVRVLTAQGPKPLPDGVLNVAAGATTEVPLSAFAGQDVAIEVTADVPIVSGARTLVRQSGRPGDLAWAGAALPVTGLSGVPLPDAEGLTSDLGLLATGTAASVEVVTVRLDGTSATSRVDLPADRFVRVRLDGTQAVWVRTSEGAGPIHATTWTAGEDDSGPLLTSTAIRPAPIDAPTRRIVPLP